MFKFLPPFQLNSKRFSRVVTCTEKQFFGFYKRHEISLDWSEHRNAWSVDVRHPNGGMLYEGYAQSNSLADALMEALDRAGLYGPAAS